ncbi:MAG: CpsB/CapC family capsule biosynthesis tyrosine phosphatase [Acutalibacteraceae bacterium]|nr:CpsB/CapC family capsule biosynthesis tyrosine phosphatase [Acutalibacteraceae bacterium]
MKRYDIHSHILPSIDDGASDIDISLLLLEELENQGVTHLALTPHFYTQYEEVENRLEEFIEAREYAYNQLKECYSGGLTLTFGAEVHLSENILLIKNLKTLCYRSTNFMLIEMPYNSTFPDNEVEILSELINKHKIIPVIAHIERYPALLKNKQLLNTLKEMGCIMQINTESLNKLFLKGKIIKLIKEGYVTVLGSDTHSTMRGCDYGRGFSVIEKSCDNKIIENICNASNALFNL